MTAHEAMTAHIEHITRNTHPEPMFKPEDFVAFQLFAGKAPALPGADPRSRKYMKADDIYIQLQWIEKCDQFVNEYLDPRYPYAKWMYFLREFQYWLDCQDSKEER